MQRIVDKFDNKNKCLDNYGCNNAEMLREKFLLLISRHSFGFKEQNYILHNEKHRSKKRKSPEAVKQA